MIAERVVTTIAEFRGLWPDLRHATIFDLDLRGERVNWSESLLEGSTFFGCRFQDADRDRLAALGAMVLSLPVGSPFKPYRSALYDYAELTTAADDDPTATLDGRMASWFASSSSTSIGDLAIRAVHDATVDAAIARFVVGRRVVGVMGGHALSRDSDLYTTVADVGRELTRKGLCVASGGGPGVMEAANLGAWFAALSDPDLDEAIAILAEAPTYAPDPLAYDLRTREVRRRWPAGGESLGVPTWVYADEPTSGFASHIGKYFTNSVRENGLLAIARSGVIYAPGGAGTEQEIFTDTAQNSLTLYQVRSPMVFLGRHHFEVERADLLAAVRRQATAFGWAELIAVCDEPSEVVAFIAEHDPDETGTRDVKPRRAHQDMRL
jgi:predicted Rossmann-fold nucleotide-binding protein